MLRRYLALAVLTVMLFAFYRGATTALAVSYAPGWNLVSGPDGSHLRGAAGNLRTLQPGDADYELLPVSAALKGGYGYWAYFPNGGSLTVGSGTASYSPNLTSGQWAMLGNPSASLDAAVVGATAVLTYTPGDGYHNADRIAPGQGAWVQGPGKVSLAIIGQGGQGQPAPPVPALAAGANRFSGALLIEGRPAPAGTQVEAFIGETLCGSRLTAEDGRYSVDVAAVATAPGCGQSGAAIQFAVVPGFGSGWRLTGSAVFQSDAATQRDLDVDLTRLRPDAQNVPWTGVRWADPGTVSISPCFEMSQLTRAALQDAQGQWRDATRSQGLHINLLSGDAGTVCNQDAPGIAVVEDTLDAPGVIAATTYLDASGSFCRRDRPCSVYTAVIIVDTAILGQVAAAERPNVIAHEIGHALGLGHAVRCDGGTIMWADTKCRYPLSHIGVDDVASLNRLVAGVQMADGANTAVGGGNGLGLLDGAPAGAWLAGPSLDDGDDGSLPALAAASTGQRLRDRLPSLKHEAVGELETLP